MDTSSRSPSPEAPVRAVVLGATGFIGSRLVGSLRASGGSVVAATRSEAPRSWELQGVEIDRHLVPFLASDGDLGAPPPAVVGLLADATIVFDLAADATYGDGAHYAADARRAQRLATLLRKHAPQLRRLVYASSIAAVERADGQSIGTAISEDDPTAPRTDYGRAKLDAEHEIAASGVRASIARLGWVVGAGMRTGSHVAVFARTAIEHPIVRFAALDGIAPLVHVSDAVSALMLLAGCETDETVTVNVTAYDVTISEILERAAGSQRRSLAVPDAVIGWLPYKLRCLLRAELSVSGERLRSLGWRPRMGLEAALDEVIAAERARLDVQRPPGGATVVTGAASGLGREVARELGSTGRTLVLVDRNEADLESLCLELGARSVVGDVTDDLVDDRILTAALDLGGVSEAFLCAGIGSRGRFGTLDRAREVLPLRVNLEARARMAHVLVREMRLRNFGRLALVSSSSALVAMPEFASYAASNAGLLAFGSALAEEWRPFGIEVVTVCPGGMKTNFQASSGVRELEGERLLDPADVAGRVLEAFGSGRTVVYVGGRSKAMNLVGRALPRGMAARVMGRLARQFR